MKIERLLNILVYLFNHKRVSAKALAQRFDVSLRTIQRDIDTLTLAGFPIIAYIGYQGGYELMEDYKLPIRLADDQDYQSMIVALRGLQSAFPDRRMQATLEKWQSLSAHGTSSIDLDLSVLRENQDQNTCISSILSAIKQKRRITCTYRNAQGEESRRQLEPNLLQYRWYAWYFIAYDIQKQEYRRFKIARVKNIHLLNAAFIENHAPIEEILQTMDANNNQEYYDFDVRCQEADAAILNEYFNGKQKREQDLIVVHLHLPKNEWQWKGRLLAMGNRIEILNHDQVKAELCRLCRQFLSIHA